VTITILLIAFTIMMLEIIRGLGATREANWRKLDRTFGLCIIYIYIYIFLPKDELLKMM